MARKNYKKKERSNHMLSLTIASSISEIVKCSVDDNFRKLSFEALGVSSTKDVENEIYTKLLTYTENPKSFVPQTVTFDDKSENQSIPKSLQTNLSQSLSQLEGKCEVFTECSPDLSETIFSQTCSQILQEQEKRRLRQKNIILSTNSEIITSQIHETLFSQTTI